MTEPKNVRDCAACSHIFMQHDENGECMVGRLIGSPCHCMGWMEEK